MRCQKDMENEDMLKLLLFDIDGTLIRSGGAGRTSMEKAFKKLYGIENGFGGIEMMGRTDPAILAEALEKHDLELRPDQVSQFMELYFQFLKVEIQVPLEGKIICPGIPSLLSALQARSDLILGLLTGNWRTSGMIKLGHFGIDKFFTLGAFGDDSSIREELVPVALERFVEKRGERIVKENVYIIGDTPLDIHCARPHGVRTVAVATGFHSVEQLAAEEPDFLFQNFKDTDKVLEVLNK